MTPKNLYTTLIGQLRARPSIALALGITFVLPFNGFAQSAVAARPSESAVTASTLARGRAQVVGLVTNQLTGKGLSGATVKISGTDIQVETDETGRYRLMGVPAGTCTLSASYMGLDTQTRAIEVVEGSPVELSFELTSDVYKLDTFQVAGVREGAAAAIVNKRNAAYRKDAVDVDSLGQMPNMNAGELAIRLAGAAGIVDDDGVVSAVTIRGMARSLNSMSVDGVLVPPTAEMSRGFQAQFMTSAIFQELEIIKGHTPEMPAASLGGTINLKTVSPLNMRETRRIRYNFGAVWAPSFTDQIPLRRDHPLQPLMSFGYDQKFDVFGGKRNLAITVNGFNSHNTTSNFITLRNYPYIWDGVVYMSRYHTRDGLTNRKQRDGNLRADFRYSRNTVFSLSLNFTDHFEPGGKYYEKRASTGQVVATLDANGNPTGTGGIMPGWTSTFTRVLPVASSTMEINQNDLSFNLRTRGASFKGEHTYADWKIDYRASYSQTHTNLGSVGNNFTMLLRNVGWTIDTSKSELYPEFIQTAGPAMSDYRNYSPSLTQTRKERRESSVGEAAIDVQRAFRAPVAFKLKAGASVRQQASAQIGGLRRWTYNGTDKLLPDENFITEDFLRTGRVLPTWESNRYMNSDGPLDPALWTEDVYYREQQRYLRTRDVEETISAAYFLADGNLTKKLRLLAGVRYEATEIESFGRVRAHPGSTAAQRTADPYGSAQIDYANSIRRINGDYGSAFPSAHLVYNLTDSLKARVSWSTSAGRPEFTALLPQETFNDTLRTLFVGNPDLKPQYARNWDLALEYYLKPIGEISASWFRKDIEDYILNNSSRGTVGTGPDNGYDGDYAGYELRSAINLGEAKVDGFELSYQQQLSFLPAPLKGFGVSANYTKIKTSGNYGDVPELAGFIPETANFNLTYKYRKFSGRVSANYTSDYLSTYAVNIAEKEWRRARTVINAGVAWTPRPQATLFCDVGNLTDEPIIRYRGKRDRMSFTSVTGVRVVIGVRGQF